MKNELQIDDVVNFIETANQADMERILSAYKVGRNRVSRQVMVQLAEGDSVMYTDRKGVECFGRIEKVNSTRVKVQVTRKLYLGIEQLLRSTPFERWNVPPVMLKKVNEEDIMQKGKKAAEFKQFDVGSFLEIYDVGSKQTYYAAVNKIIPSFVSVRVNVRCYTKNDGIIDGAIELRGSQWFDADYDCKIGVKKIREIAFDQGLKKFGFNADPKRAGAPKESAPPLPQTVPCAACGKPGRSEGMATNKEGKPVHNTPKCFTPEIKPPSPPPMKSSATSSSKKAPTAKKK